MTPIPPRSWVEIDAEALTENIKRLRALVGDEVILAPCVKANAYGHGIVLAGEIFIEAGADWLCVDSIFEAIALRKGGITVPIYIFGYVTYDQLSLVVEHACTLMVTTYETIRRLQKYAQEKDTKIKVHIKAETGNNRQGMRPEDILDFARTITACSHLVLEGISTHFANIEDVERHDFAALQQQRFDEVIVLLEKENIHIPIKHCANSAATMMYPETHYTMVRPGVACYGIWPSPLFRECYRDSTQNPIELSLGFAWKTKIAQIKKVPQGETIGYGRTYTTSADAYIAIIPVGYYDGYDRQLSNKGYVYIQGVKCPVVGRVCMNMIMVDVTEIHESLRGEEEVLLLGKDTHTGCEVSLEEYARMQDRIEYELPTRVSTNPIEEIPRIRV